MRFRLIYILLFCSNLTFAQINYAELDSVYTVKNLKSKNKASIANDSELDNFKNCIRILPIGLLARGIPALGYERIFADFVGLELMSGITFGADLIQKATVTYLDFDINPKVGYLYENSSGSLSSMGNFIQLGSRFYISSDEEANIYFGVHYRKSSHKINGVFNYTYTGSYSNPTTNVVNYSIPYTSTIINNHFLLTFGGHKKYSNHFMIDSYIGLAMGTSKYKPVVFTFIDDYNETYIIEGERGGGNFTNFYENSFYRFQNLKVSDRYSSVFAPMLLVGMNLGLGF